MADDREVYEFSYALYLARQVDREAAQLITEAAEEELIQINKATDLLMELSRHRYMSPVLGDVIAALLSVRSFR